MPIGDARVDEHAGADGAVRAFDAALAALRDRATTGKVIL